MPPVRTVTDARADDDRHARRSACHVVQVRRLVDELIHRRRQELAEAHLDDWPASKERSAYRGPHHRRFRDRRLENPLRSELFVQALGALHRSPEASDVLANQEHARVAAHLERDRLDDRFHVREATAAGPRCGWGLRGHAKTSSMPSSASPASTAACARSTASVTSPATRSWM